MKLIHLLYLCLAVTFHVARMNAQSGWYIQHQDSLGPELLSIQFSDPSNGWTVGDGNTILHTEDGGKTWYHQTNPTTGNCLSDVCFVDSLHGWAAGSLQTIVHTTNGGESWEIQRHADEPNGIESICFADTVRGWAVGGVGWVDGHFILRTNDGGKTWDEQTRGPGILRAAYFADSLRGLVVGDNGAIRSTTDGGTTWTEKWSGTHANLFSLSFPRKLNGWVLGRSEWGHLSIVLRTTDGGESWNEQFRDSTRWLAAIHFSDVHKGWVTGRSEEYASILHTTDGGKTWSEQLTGIRHLTVRSIHFTDSVSGWSVGDRCTIFHTTDGGVTFIKHARAAEVPLRFMLGQNYPNPFNPTTRIAYGLAANVHVRLTVMNMLGQEVATLVNGNQEVGYYEVTFDGKNLSSGLYFYRLQAGEFVAIKRLLLIR